MGEKEDESCAHTVRGSYDCVHASAIRRCVRSHKQPNESRLVEKTVEHEGHYVNDVKGNAAIFARTKISKSIESEFVRVEGGKDPPPTPTARLLEDGAAYGFKKNVLTRDENRAALNNKGKVVVSSFYTNCQCSAISRMSANEYTSSQRAKRNFQFDCASTTLPLGQPRREFVSCGPISPIANGWGDIYQVNKSVYIGAGESHDHFQRYPVVVGPPIDDKTSLSTETHTSNLLCDQAYLDESSLSEGTVNKEEQDEGHAPSTFGAGINIACFDTHRQVSTSSPSVSLEGVTPVFESGSGQITKSEVSVKSVAVENGQAPTLEKSSPSQDKQTVAVLALPVGMGNTPPFRAQREDTSDASAKSEQSLQSSVDGKVDLSDRPTEDQRSKTRVCTIPDLVVSDSSVDQKQTGALSAMESETSQDRPFQDVECVGAEKADGETGKPRLRPLTSTDSAYSSDSRCTSTDCASLSGNRAEEADYSFPEASALLSPPTITLDTRSVSSSSSGSSSPSHATLGSATASAGSLRVMSEFGLQRKLSSSSGSSFRSSLSLESEDDMLSSDGELRDGAASKGRRHLKAQSPWIKVRRMVIWSPFMQSFKKKYPWVQLAGHTGNFQPGEEGCILKKYCQREAEALSRLSEDIHLGPYAPEYHGVVEKDGERYTRMQDLLLAFDCPSVMDCKMGIRTYLEDELVKAKIKPRWRHDMYMKMTEISPDEPTAEEHERKAVTKPRYMQWREHVSSSSNLAFRIEGIKKGDKDPSKDYKLTKTRHQIKSAFKYFIQEKVDVLEKYIGRLKDIRSAAERSDFFVTHEVIGSSLLFVHDQAGTASVWMIDFGKTTQLPDNKRLTHREEWVEGNREDGYLFGMDNLIDIFQEILNELRSFGAVGDCSTPAHLMDNPLVSWALSAQSSGESFDLGPPDSPPIFTASCAAVDSPRKPPLKRQVAATYSHNDDDDAPKLNGDVTMAAAARDANGDKSEDTSPTLDDKHGRAENATEADNRHSDKT